MGDIQMIKDEFAEVDTRTVDDRSRVTLGSLIGNTRRVRVCINQRGEILLRPIVEIPASEHWLLQNQKALEAVRRGLKDAAKGRITKLKAEEL